LVPADACLGIEHDRVERNQVEESCFDFFFLSVIFLEVLLWLTIFVRKSQVHSYSFLAMKKAEEKKRTTKLALLLH
jgi:hypothetical protein